MTLLMTVLTLFLGGQPSAAVPPEPEPTTASRPYEAAFAGTTADDPFGLPLITLPAWHHSPSLMVAAPPQSCGTEFDVFSPAVRPPHEFPTLFPCPEVTLVACPAPLPALDPPAIRHVSFIGDGAEFRVAQAGAQAAAECEAGTCPLAFDRVPCLPGMVFTQRVFGLAPQGLLHHPAHAVAAGQVCQPVGLPPVCPVGFGGPADGPHSPFPGAKSVQHVVSATYDVPHETAKSLVQVLENGNGVLGCTINGDELTVNAHAPAQMAIAQFLAHVVTEPRTVRSPSKTISVHHTETKPCSTECSEAKACTTECSAAKCCKGECCKGECGEKCGCTCGTKEAGAKLRAAFNSAKGKSIECLGITDCKPCPPPADNDVNKKVFSFFVGLSDCKACPATATRPKAAAVQSTQTKPVIVKIQATPDGVLLQTSDGTQVRAQSIQLETQGLGKLKIEQGVSVHVPALGASY